MNNLNIDQIMVFKVLFSKKSSIYFITYRHDGKIKPLYITLLKKMSEYGKIFDRTKYMLFLIENENCSKDYCIQKNLIADQYIIKNI